MHSLTSQPTTDPTPIYRCRDGLYATDLLAAALVWLDFFTWLNDRPSDKAAICRALVNHCFETSSRTLEIPTLLFPELRMVVSTRYAGSIGRHASPP